jgi:tetratricopeptide (TPR) repeat protein
MKTRILSAAVLWAGVILAAGCGVSEEYEKAMVEGKKAFREKKFTASEALFSEALSEESDEGEAIFYHARSLSGMGRFSDAYTRFRSLLANDDFPSFPTTHKALVLREMGALLLRQALDRGETSFHFKALKFFNDALRAMPDSYESLFGKGIALYGLDKVFTPDTNRDSAYRYFKKCVRISPSRPEALYFLGLCHEKDRRLSSWEALKIYRRAVAVYGDPALLKPKDVKEVSVFEASVKTLDGNYLLRVLGQIVPLLAKLGPEKLGLEIAAARKLARRRFDAYVRLGGQEKMPAETVAWMEGTPTAPKPVAGSGPGPAATSYPRSGLRPGLAVLSPKGGEVRTSIKTLKIEASVTDDRKGAALRVFVNNVEIHPSFDMRFFEGVPFGQAKGVKTVARFTVDLGEGKNIIRLKASDTEGLSSEEAGLTAYYRPASLYALVAATAGPKGRATLAVEDASRFMDYLSGEMAVPTANRILLTGAGLTVESFENALSEMEKHLFEQDVLVVYFSGQGSCVTGKAGPQWGLALNRFDGKGGRGFIPLSRLGKILRNLPLGRLVVVLDASFTGAPGKGLRTAEGSAPAISKSCRDRVTTLFDVPAKKADQFVFLGASDGRGEALEIRSTNRRWAAGGLFTTFFLRGLVEKKADADRDGRVTLGELRPYLKDHVSFFSARMGRNQVPVVAGKDDRPLFQ